MATISETSRVLYYHVSKEELAILLEAAQILFGGGHHLSLKVRGTFTERETEELAFLENSDHEVNTSLLYWLSSRGYLVVKTDGEWMELMVPERIDQVLFERK